MAATDAAVVQEANNAVVATATSITVALTGVTAGNTLEVFAGCGSGTGVTMSCSDSLNGSYGSPLFQKVPGTATIRVAAWVFPNSAGGNVTVTITFSATITARTVWVKELKNVGPARDGTADASSQLTPGTGADGVTGSITLTGNPGFVSAVAYHVVATGGVATVSAGTGWTNGISGWAFASSGGGRSESRRFTSTGAKSATFTTSTNSEHDVLLIGYDEAPAAAAAGAQDGLAAAASASEAVPGTGAGAQSGLIGAASSLETVPGIAAGAQSGLTGASVASETVPGTAAGAQTGLAGAAAGLETVPSSGAGTQAGLAGVASASEAVPSTGAGAQPGLSGSASGLETEPGSGSGSLDGLSGAVLIAVAVPPGTFDGNLPGLVGAAAGSERLPGSAAGAQAGLTGAASAIEIETLSAAGLLARLVGGALVIPIAVTAAGELAGLTGAARARAPLSEPAKERWAARADRARLFARRGRR